MTSSEPDSLSRIYVLRCWLEPQVQPSPAPPPWRFRLENVRDEQAAGFATLDELTLFLQKTFGNDEKVKIKESN